MFLELDHVSVRYPGGTARAAVDGVSLGLAQGEIGVLIGPSGCGKTSLLRAIAGLEPLAHGRIAQELRAILKQAAATALFVTHDQLEAFAVGDVIGVMHEGRLHQWDDAYTLYHRPATRFVADFIGHGVFAPACIVDGAECPLPDAFGFGQCEVLLRADDIVHDDDAPVKAEIMRKAFRGSEFLYTLRLATGETLLAHVPSHHDHRIGEWIGIRAQVDHVVTFEREGGAAAPPMASFAV